MGVFDGTVREFASEWVHTHILPIFKQTDAFVQFEALPADRKAKKSNWALLEDAMHQAFLETDRQLIAWCAAREIHYSSSTGVCAIIYIPAQIMITAHVGDSHCVLGTKRPGGELVGRSLTPTHKPDTPSELARIEAAGGSLVYLHGGKPFIRGGDFKQRHHAMQLNYSRAFGGKDLKMYGLSCSAETKQVSLKDGADGKPRIVILGSDGLWDVIEPTPAIRIAADMQAKYLNRDPSGDGRTPSQALIDLAL
jgi:protein phosphatase